MKKVILFVLSLFCALVFVGCKEEPQKEQKPETDKGIVTEAIWNEQIKNLGFLSDPDLNYKAYMYMGTIDLNQPDFCLEKDGLLFKATTFVSGGEHQYNVYLDFSNIATTGKMEDYQKYDIEGEEWYIYDADYSFEDMLYELGFYQLSEFSACTYVDGVYKGKGVNKDSEEERDTTYRFENGKLVEYSQSDGSDLEFLFKIESFDKVRIHLPETHHLVDMTYEEMGKYVSYVAKTLKSYKAIDFDEFVAYDNLISVGGIFLRGYTSDGAMREASVVREELRKLFLENYFHRLKITEEKSTDTMWVGKIEGSTRKVVFIYDEEEPVYFDFAIMDEKILEVYEFVDYLVKKYDDSILFYDDCSFVPSKDTFMISYQFREGGTIDDIVNAINDAVESYTNIDLSWTSSSSDDFEHLEYFESDDMAVRFRVISGDRENLHLVTITICVSFGDLSPDKILEYGFENPLFD